MKKEWKYDIWGEGKYFDLWSINHILSGIVLAGLAIFVGVDFWLGLLIAFLIMLAWEIYELIKPIEEFIENRVIDMIVGILGFVIIYPLFLEMDKILFTTSFITVTSIFIFLELWGFVAYKKRNR
jgi:hypothetical protein